MGCSFGDFSRLKSSWVRTLLLAAFLFVLMMFAIKSSPHLLNPMAFKRSPSPQSSLPRANSLTRYQNETLQQLPHVIIIGVPKAGTYALLRMLSLHSGVATTEWEVHFFDLESNYEMGYSWYVSKMPYAFPDQLTVEQTAIYFPTSNVPERIHQMNPDIKLLLIVREPTDRVVSGYTHGLYMDIANHRIIKPIEDFLFKDGQLDLEFKGLNYSLYYVHMQNWLKYFPLKNFHIVDGDELVKDPVPEMKKVERFLGLEPQINSSFFVFNEKKGFYCLKEHGQEQCLSTEKGRAHPYVEPDILQKLHQFFHEPNKRFFKLVGHTFNWK
ncbi:heparan sulfate glucosamine 3-O-sulfotransferase 1-like [Brachionichthys hirsutus]|uniref:heparan sulfate glucosamine 3-O-sulfotransferase 1-like n=1 Tax=Brachionichthys hirsutus TaxID=412623 RepID=UPI003604A8FF